MKSDNFILSLGLSVLTILMFLPGAPVAHDYLTTLRHASSSLRGEAPFSDIASNIVGFRALYYHTDPYPVIGPALKTIGVVWDVRHTSTHPPTAYLPVAPVAFLPWPLASAIAWTYSLMPLLPVLIFFLGRRQWLLTIIALCCILLPCFFEPWGEAIVVPIVIINLLVGVAFLIDAYIRGQPSCSQSVFQS